MPENTRVAPEKFHTEGAPRKESQRLHVSGGDFLQKGARVLHFASQRKAFRTGRALLSLEELLQVVGAPGWIAQQNTQFAQNPKGIGFLFGLVFEAVAEFLKISVRSARGGFRQRELCTVQVAVLGCPMTRFVKGLDGFFYFSVETEQRAEVCIVKSAATGWAHASRDAQVPDRHVDVARCDGRSRRILASDVTQRTEIDHLLGETQGRLVVSLFELGEVNLAEEEGDQFVVVLVIERGGESGDSGPLLEQLEPRAGEVPFLVRRASRER